MFKSWAVTRGPSLDPRREAARGRGRGPPARLRRLRRHDPEGPVWRRHGRDLGSRLLVRRRSGKGPCQGRPQIRADGREAEGRMGAGADEARPQRRQAHQLAADQASRRIFKGRRRRRRAQERSLGRLRPYAEADRRGQGQGAEAVHDDQADRDCSRRSGIRTRALAADARASGNGKTPAKAPRPRVAKAAQPQRARMETRAKDGQRERDQSRRTTRLRRAAALRQAARPPSSDGWVHEIKFDGYRIQMRVEDGEVSLKTRKALDWTDKFSAIAQGRRDSCPTPSSTARSSRSNDKRRSGFFRACRPRSPSGNTDDLVYFAFDLLFAERRGSAAAAAARTQGAAARAARASTRARKPRPLRYVEHFDANGEQMMNSAREAGLEGVISKQATAPYRSGRSGSWVKIKSRPGHEVVIGGWTSNKRQIPLADGRRE